jgi:hydroxymethylbilane synthase
VIKTTGDRVLDRPLKEIGGKGLFTREIEDDLLSGRIDIAVHSMKDMPTEQPTGLILDTYLPREDVRDAFVSLTKDSMDALEAGQKLGSSSLRRKAQLMLARPDLEVVEFRGNVQTRLKKLEDGVADATFLGGCWFEPTGAIAYRQILLGSRRHVARSGAGRDRD